MNKSDLVNRVSESIDGGRTAASRAVEAVIEAIQEAVTRGEKVAISGFGVFEKVERAARVRRGDHRLLGKKRLVRDEAVILVDRRVVDTAAARVEIGQLRVVDAARAFVAELVP